MKRPLDKLSVSGFKSIRELRDFELRPLNVLIGANGSGKSNFVEFFKLLAAMIRPDGLNEYVMQAGGADVFLFGGQKTTSHINVALSFGNDGYAFEWIPTEDASFLVGHEVMIRVNDTGTLWERVAGTGNKNPAILVDKNEKGIFDGYHDAVWHTYEAICSWKTYQFHDTTKEAGVRRFQEAGNDLKLASDAANPAPYLLKLKHKAPETYDRIVRHVRMIAPFFHDFILKEEHLEGKVRLRWQQKGLSDYPMMPSQLSDGTLRFICLATALLQPDEDLPSTLILDEPELGLHPEAISLLAELIKSASQRTQVIIATQSPLLVNAFSPEDIIVVKRQDGASPQKFKNAIPIGMSAIVLSPTSNFTNLKRCYSPHPPNSPVSQTSTGPKSTKCCRNAESLRTSTTGQKLRLPNGSSACLAPENMTRRLSV
jgi:predicted ATPase